MTDKGEDVLPGEDHRRTHGAENDGQAVAWARHAHT